MMAEPRIGVVTVTYNSAGVIDDFMASMLAQSYQNFTLYIIDNASSDATLSRLESFPDPRVVIIPNASNIGVAAGNNQGIEESLRTQCDYVLLINNDTVFGKDLVRNLYLGLLEHGSEIIVPKMMYFDNKNLIWFAGGRFVKWKLYANVHIGENEVDTGAYDTPKLIQYAPTCCMLLRVSVFAKIGVMDEKYFVYYDDTDFCLRSHFKAIKMLYFPDCVLYHKVNSLTGGTESDFSLRYGHRNRLYYVHKHVPAFLGVAVLYCLSRISLKTVRGILTPRQSKIALKGMYEGLRLALSSRSAR